MRAIFVVSHSSRWSQAVDFCDLFPLNLGNGGNILVIRAPAILTANAN